MKMENGREGTGKEREKRGKGRRENEGKMKGIEVRERVL